MAGGLFSRIKNWINDEDLYHDDLNNEFDNIISHLNPTYIDGSSDTVAQMKTQVNPGSVGSESLATSLEGEIDRLRYKISQMIGGTYWYDTPAINLDLAATQLASINAAGPSNRLVSGRSRAGSSQGIFVVPSGSTNSVTIKGTTTALDYYVAGVLHALNSDVVKTGLTAAPGSNNTCTVNDATIDNSAWTKYAGEDFFFPFQLSLGGSNLPRVITVSSMGSSISSLVGSFAAFKQGSEYFIAYVQSSTVLSHVMRGFFFDNTDAPIPRATINNGATITLMKLTWLFLDTAGAVTPCYTNPTTNAIAPASPATGDFWFDLTALIWKKYTGSSWVDSISTIIGVCCQNSSTVTVAARSFDFYKNVANYNNIGTLNRFSADIMQNSNLGAQISVNGNDLNFQGSLVIWKLSTDIDPGVSLGANTNSFLYLTETGKPVISDVGPYDRRQDLRGFYHPYQTWRCLGWGLNDDASTFNATSFELSDLVGVNELAGLAVNTKNLIDKAVTAAKTADATMTGTQMSSNINLPGGNVRTAGKSVVVGQAATASSQNLAIIRVGFNGATGAVTRGEGASVSTHAATGIYTILFTPNFTDAPAIVVTPFTAGASIAQVTAETLAGCTVQFSVAGSLADPTDFNLIAIGQREP